MAVGRIARWGLLVCSLAALALALLLGRLAMGPPALAPPPPTVVLSGLTVVNPGIDRAPGRTLSIRDGRIEAISEAIDPEASDRYAGSFALPGLVDLHVHHPPAAAFGERALFALLFLAHGVTSVRDTGSFDDAILDHRLRLARGQLAGPRLFVCGRMLDGDPPGWPRARSVRGPEQARRAVAELAEQGVDCVKLYNGLTRDETAALVEAAHERRLPVVAHVPDAVPFDALAGVEVQHLMGLTEEWSRPSQRVIDRYVRHSLVAGISHTPTLVAFERGARLADYQALRRDAAAQLLPRHYRELLWNPQRNPIVHWLSPGSWTELDARLVTMRRVVSLLHRSGVPILLGTDTMNPFVVPGASLHEELRQIVASGLDAEQAWARATRGAGEALGVPDLGWLRPGAPADVALFARDPTRDLAALGTLRAVVAAGRLYPRETLEAALERQRGHFEGPLYAGLVRFLARLLIPAVHAAGS